MLAMDNSTLSYKDPAIDSTSTSTLKRLPNLRLLWTPHTHRHITSSTPTPLTSPAFHLPCNTRARVLYTTYGLSAFRVLAAFSSSPRTTAANCSDVGSFSTARATCGDRIGLATTEHQGHIRTTNNKQQTTHTRVNPTQPNTRTPSQSGPRLVPRGFEAHQGFECSLGGHRSGQQPTRHGRDYCVRIHTPHTNFT